MIQITPKNLTTAPINWALLPKDLQSEKENLELYEEFYDDEPSIRKNVDKLIVEIKKTHQTQVRKPAPKKAKGVKKLPKTKTPAKLPRKKKKVAKKTAAPKKRTAAKRTAKNAVRKNGGTKAKQEKAPITIKKLSFELQLIKSFAAMAGKNRKVATVKSFLSKIQAAKRDSNVPSQKSILTLVARRMKEGLEKLDKGVDTLQNIQIEAGLLKRCKEAVKNAKPRLQVTYLSGVKGKK